MSLGPMSLKNSLSKQASLSLGLENLRRKASKKSSILPWPEQYVNVQTGQIYAPHNEDEQWFVYEDGPRHLLLKGGEGGGKSTAGIVKNLERLRRGMSGIMVSPDFEHFKKTWREFVNWCPWYKVIERHRYRSEPGWEPTRPFVLVFENDLGNFSELRCGGVEESKVGSWEGPNVSFVHWDEARHHRTDRAIKVLAGRVRITGPNGEKPQLYLTSTPRKHWMYDYFGPPKDNDPLADFKANSFVGTILTEENKENLSENYVEERGQTLTEAEKRVYLKAEWEDETDVEKFVNIIWWDNCKEPLPAITRSEPMVIALDAAEGSQSTGPQLADTFAMIGVTRHPERPKDVAVRYCGIWQPEKGKLLDYEPIKVELKRLCKEFSVIEVAYDPTQLHYFCSQLQDEGVAFFRRFSQQGPRLQSDKQLQTLISSRRISHDGNPLLRQHIDNANVKKYGEVGIRIVKRSQSQKVDSAVALAMASDRILYYNL